MPRLDGLGFVQRYREAGGEALVIMMSAYGTMDTAVEAMRLGAYDYISKPFNADEVILAVRKAEERESLRREVRRLRAAVVGEAEGFEQVIGRSAPSAMCCSSPPASRRTPPAS
jgi:two-component system, NtrC family, response regulator AtoC